MDSFSSTYSSIQSKVEMVKGNIFTTLEIDPCSFVHPSAYDTAWLALIPNAQTPNNSKPMFSNCLHWVLNNQSEQGFWGLRDAHGMPTIECLPSTLACMVALKKWKVGAPQIDKALAYIHANVKDLLKDMNKHCPRWFAIVFPSMLQLTQTVGIEIAFPHEVEEALSFIFAFQKHVLEKEKSHGVAYYPPLLAYLEALPSAYDIDENEISKNLGGDGSLFHSPSATAQAFMVTGKTECLVYLKSLVQKCPDGVPPTYPLEDDTLKLCMINHIQRLGLGEHFPNEIEQTLTKVYRNYTRQESWVKPTNTEVALQLYKDSLAFRLLRMHGYDISPPIFCWFLRCEEVRSHIEENCEHMSSLLLNIYRASDVMFSGEREIEEARTFSMRILHENILKQADKFSNFQAVIQHELNLPWLARLDHLEHRMWIEQREANVLWTGKSSFLRISTPHSDELVQLARLNYEFRQSVYQNELEQLRRWSKDMGLSGMGFGREKTTYCYFAVSAATALPYDSYVRLLIAKSAILITVADDFYDMEGTLSELECLTSAIQRWDSKGLRSHSKTIFDALDGLVHETATMHLQQEGTDITRSLKNLWYETFLSWLVETKWSKEGHTPSIDDCLKTGMTSIAVHTMILPALCILKPSLPIHKLRPDKYETITELLMVITRLLNDLQSYQREKDEGKKNSLLVSMAQNPDVKLEESASQFREMINGKKKELLEHVLMDGLSDLPQISKDLHLQCLKVFQMLFNSTNRYDSNSEMLHDIQRAIYVPLEIATPNRFRLPCFDLEPKKKYHTETKAHMNLIFKQRSGRASVTTRKVYWRSWGNGFKLQLPIASKLVTGLI